MSNTIVAWVIANKEWSFTVLCAVSGGVFAFLKWKWLIAKNREKSRFIPEDSIAQNGSGNTFAAIGRGAVVTGGVITGSHNVQTVLINPNLHLPQTPIQERKSSAPTGNEIRKREDGVVKGVPLVMQRDVLQRYRNSFLNVSVAWPIKIHGVYPQRNGEIITVDARYGEENWGALIRFDVRGSDYPILNTLEEGHSAFLRGRIAYGLFICGIKLHSRHGKAIQLQATTVGNLVARRKVERVA